LQTISTHLKLGVQNIKDAQVDNKGKCEAFSPADMLAISLATCILKIIGYYCRPKRA